MERQENLEKLVTSLENTGYERFIPQVIENFEEGKNEFKAKGESFDFGGNKLECELVFGTIDKKENKGTDNRIYWRETIASATRIIKIPEEIVQGLNTADLESRLKKLPTSDAKGYMENINQEMEMLLMQKPEIFNALFLKYKPDLLFKIPDAVVKEQTNILAKHNPSYSFSTYFNLTPLELYNSLCGRFVCKKLFKRPTEEININGMQDVVPKNTENRMFTSWLDVNLNNRNGEPAEINLYPDFDIYKKAVQFNLLELQERDTRWDLIRLWKKGCEVIVNNLNEKGDSQIRTRANPRFKDLELITMKDKPIRNLNIYRKRPFKKEIGEFAEITRKSQPSRNVSEDIPQRGQRH